MKTKFINAQMTGYQIRKSADGQSEERIVTGVLAEEAPDRDNEIMDYAASKPYFEKWNSTFSEKTAGKSVGNLRAMHKPIAAGKFVNMAYDDDAKKVVVEAQVVNDDEWKNVEEGVYTGFSIGARVVGKKVKDAATGAWKYVADPYEGSLVDNPAMYGATFTAIKADGTKAEGVLKGGIAKIPLTKANALKIISDANMATLEMTEREEVRKGFYTVSWFANICDQLNCLAQATAYERDDEGDGSPIPDSIKALAKQLGALLVQYVQEEVNEAAGEPGAGEDAVAEVVVEAAAGKQPTEDELNLPGMRRKKSETNVEKVEKVGAKHSKETKAAFKELRQQTQTILGKIDELLGEEEEQTPAVVEAAAGKKTEAAQAATVPAPGGETVEKITISKSAHAELVEKAARTEKLEGELLTIKGEVEKLAKRAIPSPVKINASATVVPKDKDSGTNEAPAAEKTATPIDAIKLAMQHPNQKLAVASQ